MLTLDEIRDSVQGGPTAERRAAGERLSETLRATFTITESTNPSIEVGSEAAVGITTRSLRHEQVRAKFASCEAPTRPGRLAQILGKTATCNGIRY